MTTDPARAAAQPRREADELEASKLIRSGRPYDSRAMEALGGGRSRWKGRSWIESNPTFDRPNAPAHHVFEALAAMATIAAPFEATSKLFDSPHNNCVWPVCLAGNQPHMVIEEGNPEPCTYTRYKKPVRSRVTHHTWRISAQTKKRNKNIIMRRL